MVDMPSLLRLAGFAMGHAIWQIAEGHGLTTMTFTIRDGERVVVPYAANDQRDAIGAASEDLASLAEGDMAVLAMDTYASLGDEPRRDAVVVRLFGPAGAPLGLVVQTYRSPVGLRVPFVTRKPEFKLVGELWVDDDVTYPNAERFVLEGVAEHPEGGRYFVGGNA